MLQRANRGFPRLRFGGSIFSKQAATARPTLDYRVLLGSVGSTETIARDRAAMMHTRPRATSDVVCSCSLTGDLVPRLARVIFRAAFTFASRARTRPLIIFVRTGAHRSPFKLDEHDRALRFLFFWVTSVCAHIRDHTRSDASSQPRRRCFSYLVPAFVALPRLC